jgi:hypothetical protein
VLFAFMSQMGQHYSMHGSFGTFTMLFWKGKNTNTSIDRSYTNENIGKWTNQKAPFHKQLTNRNTEWLSNQIRRYERNWPTRYVVTNEYYVIFKKSITLFWGNRSIVTRYRLDSQFNCSYLESRSSGKTSQEISILAGNDLPLISGSCDIISGDVISGDVI